MCILTRPKNRILVVLVMPCALLLSCATQQIGHSDEIKTRIADKTLDALVEMNGVPGMAAAIMKGDEVIWSGSAGLRDVSQALSVDDDTIFRLASVSKLITVSAAAKLYEEGALDIDAPLQNIIPYMPGNWPDMTVRQLAAHISGIPHYQLVDANRGRKSYGTVERAVSVFADRELVSKPGGSYNYSSYGYTLLSAAIEEAAGVSYLEYIAKNITNNIAIVPDALLFGDINASQAYEFVGDKAVPALAHDYSYSWGGAGLSATASALAVFGSWVLSNKIVSEETLEMMFTPARLSDGTIVRDRDYEVGFGWRLSRELDGTFYAHHAGVSVGGRSVLTIIPDEQISTAVLSNASWVAAIEQTALTLALPFRIDDLSRAPCPVDAHSYEGEFEGEVIKGAITFALDSGICTGVLSVDNILGEWVNAFPQKDTDAFQLISVAVDGGFSRAALVTPIGVFDLSFSDGGVFVARMGRARKLSFRLK